MKNSGITLLAALVAVLAACGSEVVTTGTPAQGGEKPEYNFHFSTGDGGEKPGECGKPLEFTTLVSSPLTTIVVAGTDTWVEFAAYGVANTSSETQPSTPFVASWMDRKRSAA